MILTKHEKEEWSRFAKAAYAKDRNDVGHCFSMGAALRENDSVTSQWFDDRQEIYRAWLCFNEWPAIQRMEEILAKAAEVRRNN